MSEEIEDFENFEEEAPMSDRETIKMLEKKVAALESKNKSLKSELRKKYSIFYPKSKRGLHADYPEFKSIREFNDVSKYDLLFVWYLACDGSPFSHVDNEKERIALSLKEAFGIPDIKLQEKYLAGNYPEKVKIAISKMRSFKVAPRVMAMRMMENTLNNWREITDIDASDDSFFTGKDGVDWTKKKAFIEAGATISKNIGAIISQVEGSYAVSAKRETDAVEDLGKLIENYHESRD